MEHRVRMASSDDTESGSRYSNFTGFIFIFNLIVGTGALTLPAAFHDAGWALSSAGIIMLAFMSFLSTTFVIESMASANAMLRLRRLRKHRRSENGTAHDEVNADHDECAVRFAGSGPEEGPIQVTEEPPESRAEAESEPLLARRGEEEEEEDHILGHARPSAAMANGNESAYYDIVEIVEMGSMATLFFNKCGRTLFYISIAVYLYGDLAIYAAAVAKSLRDVACTYVPDNSTSKTNLSEQDPCWPQSSVQRLDAYRVALTLFVATVGPFAFFNVSKTKYLQMLTSLMRWMAFVFMVSLACVRLAQGQLATPGVAKLSGLPTLFGTCVYSFMCHHSLPSLVTPIRDKNHLSLLLASDYLIVLSFYILLAFTGIFAFDQIDDLYTLNFQPNPGEVWYLAAIHYFLSLFPVFTLSTNFPIIAVTLRNNLKALFLSEGRRYSWCTRRCLFPLMAILPPIGVAFATNSLEFLVGVTGSYAGAGIQYVVPAMLVYFSRKATRQAIGIGVQNQHGSSFKSPLWIMFVLAWAAGCIVMVTWNHFTQGLH